MNKRAFTLGHSNRAFSEFLHVLQTNQIDLVVDVRTYPRSRFCPHFNRRYLEQHLSANGIQYTFKGHNLGGLADNVEYEETIDELVDIALDLNICLVCSEKDYLKCHRHDMLTPSFTERGVELIHIGL